MPEIRQASYPTGYGGLFAFRGWTVRRINPDAYVSRAMAAQLTRVSADAIGKWHARGWLTPTADGPQRSHLRTKRLANGNLLYRVGDILQAEADTDASGNSRRGIKRRTAAAWAALNINSSGMAHAS